MIDYTNVSKEIQASVRKFVNLPKIPKWSIKQLIRDGLLTEQDVNNLAKAPRSQPMTTSNSDGWIHFEIDGVDRNAFPLYRFLTPEERDVYHSHRDEHATGEKCPRGGSKKLSTEDEKRNASIDELLSALELLKGEVSADGLGLLEEAVAKAKALKVTPKSSLLEKFFGVSTPEELPPEVSYKFVVSRKGASKDGDFLRDEDGKLLFMAKSADVPDDYDAAYLREDVKKAVQKLLDTGVVDMTNRIKGFAMNM